ncbi:hypothetical protein EYF80_031088 [Liparis tanakae]|uniref:Uncharacterized protein n=1 Tax=Liparis tanakae TaxID=230148 RepID=A0A4Z2H1G6_9TELE|nr:hypothetical protein EYF80_031088 [Liparis tanakae]
MKLTTQMILDKEEGQRKLQKGQVHASTLYCTVATFHRVCLAACLTSSGGVLQWAGSSVDSGPEGFIKGILSPCCQAQCWVETQSTLSHNLLQRLHPDTRDRKTDGRTRRYEQSLIPVAPLGVSGPGVMLLPRPTPRWKFSGRI